MTPAQILDSLQTATRTRTLRRRPRTRTEPPQTLAVLALEFRAGSWRAICWELERGGRLHAYRLADLDGITPAAGTWSWVAPHALDTGG